MIYESKSYLAVAVFQYPILINLDFYDFTTPFSTLFWFRFKRYQILETVLNHIFGKHFQVRENTPSATRRIFNSLLGVWKCGKTLLLAFDITLSALCQKLLTLVVYVSLVTHYLLFWLFC